MCYNCFIRESEQLYHKLEKLLIAQGYITQAQSDIITRKGHRKYGYWKRHVIDLCYFVLEVKQPSIEIETILKNAIVWCKT